MSLIEGTVPHTDDRDSEDKTMMKSTEEMISVWDHYNEVNEEAINKKKNEINNNRVEDFLIRIFQEMSENNIEDDESEMNNNLAEENDNNEEDVSGKVSEKMEEPIIMSMDAKALYVEYNNIEAAKVVQDMVAKCEWDFGSVNVRELVKYIAMNSNRGMTNAMGLKDIIPLKKTNLGRPVTMVCEEMNRPGSAGEGEDVCEESSWREAAKYPSESEKKLCIGLALRLAIMACLKNHVYRFNGQLYSQGKKGIRQGPRKTKSV